MPEQQQTITAVEYIRNVKDGIDTAFVNIKEVVGKMTVEIERLTKENADLKAAKAKK